MNPASSPTPLRVAFFGSPAFAVPALDALVDANCTLVAVYTQPPRKAGRGRSLHRQPVHERALELGLPVRTPPGLRSREEAEAFRSLEPDVAVVAAYGLLFPEVILDTPRLGCVNLHASILPRWRGAAPVERALLAGDSETGVSVMQMDAGLDTGGVLEIRRTPILPDDDTGTLRDRLADLGASRIVPVLQGLASGTLQAVPQAKIGVTYARKLMARDEVLDWREPASRLALRVRALSPDTGARARTEDSFLKVWKAVAESGNTGAEPGTIIDSLLGVACGEGLLRLLTVQRPGKRAMPAEVFLRGSRLRPGSRLPLPPGDPAAP